MVSIIILIQDRYDMVKRCLYSILAHTPRTPFELVLILQAVADERIKELVHSLQCPVVLIENKVNSGVTPGRNQGIEAATGDYMLFLDDDAYVEENVEALNGDDALSFDWLGRMTQYYIDPKVGIVGQSGSWINPSQPGIFWALPNSRGCKCDVAQGYCFMFSRAVVNKIGLLDPYFDRFWHEESEYSLRAKYNGFKVINADYIGVFHLGSGSGDDGTYLLKINYMFSKWQAHFNQILEFPRGWPNVTPVRNN